MILSFEDWDRTVYIRVQGGAGMKEQAFAINITNEVISYIANSGDAELPAEVIQQAKYHILDTLAAIVSGSTLKPALSAKAFVNNQPGAEEAQLAGSRILASAINVALAHGVMAHADETDDSHSRLLIHPGCAIVPAALSLSERQGADGMRFLKAVVTGYDIGCRITEALGMDKRRGLHFPTGAGATFGAAAAASSVLRLKDEKVGYVLSYAAQQVSGVPSFFAEDDHVEKAFVFGGMPARNGVTAAILVESGFTGAKDVFGGEHNFLKTISADSRPELLADGLGSRYEVMFTNIKKFPVGLSIQAPVDALSALIKKHGLTSGNVQSIVVRVPGYGVHTRNKGRMPNLDVRHLLAVTLLDGNLTFTAVHSNERLNDPAILEVKKRIKLVEDAELTAAKVMRQAIVEVTTIDGAQLKEHVAGVRGTPQNPITADEVEEKCKGLLAPVLGEMHARKLLDGIRHLDQVRDMRELRSLLSVP